MLIGEIMRENPITVDYHTKLCDAYALMQEKGIRHLPVIKNGEMVGIVTDRDLRLATSRLAVHPFEPEAIVEQVMSHPVQTVHPSEPVEYAIKVMRELKIGCLPVQENGTLVGIVTGANLMDAMLKLVGIHQPSGRLDIRLQDRPGEMARLTALMANRKVNIHSIMTYPENGNRLRVVLRVGPMEIRSLAKAICDFGFEIMWPPHISCVD
jgi:acetoin utilization protein AcuB